MRFADHSIVWLVAQQLEAPSQQHTSGLHSPPSWQTEWHVILHPPLHSTAGTRTANLPKCCFADLSGESAAIATAGLAKRVRIITEANLIMLKFLIIGVLLRGARADRRGRAAGEDRNPKQAEMPQLSREAE
jgi:hypothetical protein